VYNHIKEFGLNGVDIVPTQDNSPVKIIRIESLPGESESSVMNKLEQAMDIASRTMSMANMMNAGQDPRQLNRKGKNSYIQQYCNNLNELAEGGKIEPIIGRERETNEIIRTLGRKNKNSVIVLGDAGVGKTALAENLAYEIVNGTVPQFLAKKEIVSLDMTSLLAGTTLRGMFEERVKGLLEEMKKNGNYILLIDNIGTALADNGKSEYDISSMLSRSLENGECQIIGTSDYKSFRQTFTKDPSLARRFQTVTVSEPKISEANEILNGVKKSYENYHGVIFDDGTIELCVNLAKKYIADRNLPDSAIDILDEAGAVVGTVVDDDRIIAKNIQIKAIKQEIEKARNADNYTEVDVLQSNLNALIKDVNNLRETIEKEKKKNPKAVTKDDILDVVSNKTGIPVNELSSDDKKKLVNMNERLKKEVIGQDEAIDTICRALKRNRVGIHKTGCMYSAMMIGRTGVGKTLIAKKLAKEIFGTETALVRFDMSEYPDKTSVNKLIGSNPGYVGYEEGGQLTETVKKNKYCVLLLDEIEKADPEVYNIFLQVLDEGFLTDNSGQRVDFSNVIVIFTSNVGAKTASDFGKGIGFNENTEENAKRILTKQLKNRFPPEFINRIDNVIYFNSLTDENMKKIIKIELDKVCKNVEEIGYKLEYDDFVVDYVFNSIKDQSEYGARPIMRSIQENVEDKLTDYILENEVNKGDVFKCTCDENVIVVSR
jgi:ATP-dependent Clp protease ATP-binding subunit ClpC